MGDWGCDTSLKICRREEGNGLDWPGSLYCTVLFWDSVPLAAPPNRPNLAVSCSSHLDVLFNPIFYWGTA